MFSRWFRPNAAITQVFENQFGEENGALVYRRFGKGPAYRVTDGQRRAFIDQYASSYRKRHFAMSALSVLLILGVATGAFVADLKENDPLYWSIIGIPAATLVGWYLWRGRRAVVRPDRELSRNVPVAPALTSHEARRKALSQISYGTLALAPLVGLFLPVGLSDRIEIWTGWGRLVWAIPIAFTALAALQAVRKYRMERALP